MVLSKDLKIAICFGLIMGAILSICNLCFAAEKEDVNFSVVDNLIAYPDGDSFQYTTYNNLKYFVAEPGYKYVIASHFDFAAARIAVTSSVLPDVNVPFDLVYTFTEDGQIFEFTVDSETYISLSNDFLSGYITVQREVSSGLTGFINDLTLSLSVNELSIVWNYAVPILAISVLFGLGFYLLKRLLNRIKRAKGGA